MVDSYNFKKGTEPFRPRARLISVLGDQLIRDTTVGLLELVKNSYDADANHVIVKLLNLQSDPKEKVEEKTEKETLVFVEDDGFGMNLDTILKEWLEPATGNKEESKRRKERTQKGRLPLGEKGVGRFAAHKLGRELTLISRARDEHEKLAETEVVVNINWDEFDDPDAYLSDIGIDYEERKPEYFLVQSGTLLVMKNARSSWKESDVARVSRALRRLMSPFRTPESFQVTLVCPDYPKYENIDPGELLDTAHAGLTFLIDDDGNATYEYKFSLAHYSNREEEPTEVDLRKKLEDWKPVNRKPECGGFYAVFYLWDRDPDNLQRSKTSVLDLNTFNGVSVFRDGIRVMPYGEPEDDWLEIDKARYMKTSEAISRKNIVGAVEIDQATNGALKDKSNREGFIENQAFQDFRNLLLAALNIAHKEFSKDRKGMREIQKAERRELIPAITRLGKSVEKVNTSVDEALNMADEFLKMGSISDENAGKIKKLLLQTKNVLTGAVDETRQAADDTLTFLDERQEMLLTLAGLGLAAERFTHEFARLTREATLIIREVSGSTEIRGLTGVSNRVKTLETTLDALHDLVMALGPMFYIRRKTIEQEIDVHTMIDNAILLNRGDIKQNNIKVDINAPNGNLFVKIRRSSLIQVFNNLIDNSCYWLGKKSEEDDRHILITILAKDISVIVADDGPGIHPRDRDRIFDPFFSNKVNGRGLGLFIAKEVLADAQSTIELLDPDESRYTFRVGAAFRIKFPIERTNK